MLFLLLLSPADVPSAPGPGKSDFPVGASDAQICAYIQSDLDKELRDKDAKYRVDCPRKTVEFHVDVPTSDRARVDALRKAFGAKHAEFCAMALKDPTGHRMMQRGWAIEVFVDPPETGSTRVARFECD